MKFLIKYIIFCVFLISFSLSQDIKFFKDEVHMNFKNDLVENITVDKKSNKALVAVGLSAILPGLGQFYLGNRLAGSIYVAVETSLWLTRENYLSDAKISSDLYKQYAQENWSFSKWIRDYYNPTMLEVETQTGFVNGSLKYTSATIIDADNVYDLFIVGDEGDSFDDFYSLSWDQAHSAEFINNEGNVISTSNEQFFKTIYEDVCNTSVELNYICLLDLEGLDQAPSYGTDEYYSLLLDQVNNGIGNVIYSHHLYEGIGKYNMFFAGWKDSGAGYVIQNSGGYDIALSPKKTFYENNLRLNHKENNDKASDLLSIALLNRAISMFNILINNSKIRMSSNLNSSKYASNQIKLSITF